MQGFTEAQTIRLNRTSRTKHDLEEKFGHFLEAFAAHGTHRNYFIFIFVSIFTFVLIFIFVMKRTLWAPVRIWGCGGDEVAVVLCQRWEGEQNFSSWTSKGHIVNAQT